MSGISTVKAPFGESPVLELTATGDQNLTILAGGTIIDGVTVIATGNRTLNLTAGDGVVKGDRVLIQVATTATETTIFGTGVTGATITGVAGTTFTNELYYDGTEFKQLNTPVQIN